MDGRWARVICGGFATHVYRGMGSVQYGDGALDLLDEEQLERIRKS